MELINQFIRYCYEQGWIGALYDAIVVVAYLAQMIFLVLYRKNITYPS